MRVTFDIQSDGAGGLQCVVAADDTPAGMVARNGSGEWELRQRTAVMDTAAEAFLERVFPSLALVLQRMVQSGAARSEAALRRAFLQARYGSFMGDVPAAVPDGLRLHRFVRERYHVGVVEPAGGLLVLRREGGAE